MLRNSAKNTRLTGPKHCLGSAVVKRAHMRSLGNPPRPPAAWTAVAPAAREVGKRAGRSQRRARRRPRSKRTATTSKDSGSPANRPFKRPPSLFELQLLRARAAATPCDVQRAVVAHDTQRHSSTASCGGGAATMRCKGLRGQLLRNAQAVRWPAVQLEPKWLRVTQ